MARINIPSRTHGSSVERNNEGTVVKRLTPFQELKRAVMCTMLWEDGFYEDGVAIADRIAGLIPKCKPTEVAELAVIARNKMKLRHMPLFLVRELARLRSAQVKERLLTGSWHISAELMTNPNLVSDTLAEVIQRPDELTEFLAIYWKDSKQPLSAQVKKGLARAFGKFNEYELAKWNRDGAVKLRDVMFLTHPDPHKNLVGRNGGVETTAAQSEQLYKNIAEKKLETPDTWEVALSGGADKYATFTRLLQEKKLGALALLRNLRNMIEAGVNQHLIQDALANMKIERVLPFRFITAARYAPQLEPALEQAMGRCLASVEPLQGRTALVIDTSPSMWQANVSEKSEMTRFDAAAALAILVRGICRDVNVYAFNERMHIVPPRYGFALRDALAATKGSYSCGGLAVEQANKDGYDRIIVLTDGEWHYSKTGQQSPRPNELFRPDWQMGNALTVSPAPLTDKAYMINVANTRTGVGYGKWTNLDGFSEAIVDWIQQYEANFSNS